MQFRLIWLLLYLLLSGPSAAQLQIDDKPSQSLDKTVFYFEDPSGQLTLSDMQANTLKWYLNTSGALSKGFSTSHWWLRITINNPDDKQKSCFLEVGHPLLDYINVYITQQGKLIRHYASGDKLPFYSRPIDSPVFVFPIQWQPHQTLDIYLEIYSQGSIQAPLMLWKGDAYYSHLTHIEMMHGVYFGGMLSIILFNTLLFFVLRDIKYLFYVSFVISSTLLIAGLSGQAFRHLWPEATRWNDVVILLFMCLTSIFAGQFTNHFLGLKALSLWCYRIINAIGIFSIFVFILSILVSYHIASQIAIATGFTLAFFILISGVYGAYRGNRSARYFIISWFFLLVSLMAFLLSKLDFVPTNFLSENAIFFGSILETVLLSLALADRINSERQLRYNAQKELLDTSERMKIELEEQVSKRTHDLEEANKKLENLSNVDQLTRIYNRRYLENAMKDEFKRCARQKHPISILMLDVDFFKQVNDQYGHVAGDECLVQVADIIKKSVRAFIDTPARYGGEEFCVLLPESDLESTRIVAERIRERISETNIVSGDAVFSVSVSIGLFSDDRCESSAEQALKYADIALYDAKKSGRNRVILYNNI